MLFKVFEYHVVTSIIGFNELRWDDQEKIKQLFIMRDSKGKANDEAPAADDDYEAPKKKKRAVKVMMMFIK